VRNTDDAKILFDHSSKKLHRYYNLKKWLRYQNNIKKKPPDQALPKGFCMIINKDLINQ
jgi:hypothetical protein